MKFEPWVKNNGVYVMTEKEDTLGCRQRDSNRLLDNGSQQWLKEKHKGGFFR